MPATKNNQAIEKTHPQTIEIARPQQPQPFVYSPRVDVIDAGKEYVLTADLPGASRESIEVTCEQEYLTIAARVRVRDTAGTVVAREYGIGDFRRSFRIGEDIDPEAVHASYADGVLTVRMGKRKEAQPRRIAVS